VCIRWTDVRAIHAYENDRKYRLLIKLQTGWYNTIKGASKLQKQKDELWYFLDLSV